MKANGFGYDLAGLALPEETATRSSRKEELQPKSFRLIN